ITCHHSTPRTVPHVVRLRCKMLGELASATITSIERHQNDSLLQQKKSDQAQIWAQLASAPTIRDGLRAAEQHLLHFLKADSLLVQFSGHQSQLGKPVDLNDRQLLLSVLNQANGEQALFASRNLTGLDPRMEPMAEAVSGALMVRLSDNGDFLMALRREVIESRVWAGDPNKATTTDTNARIHPRKSFEQWLEKLRGHSRRWTELDRQSALELKRMIRERSEQIERARVEEALRESEARFRATFEQAAVGVAHVGLDGRWIRVNQRL